MDTLDLLKSRLEVAKAWTKPHQEEVDRNLSDYEVVESDTERNEILLDPTKRYEFKIPYIFATHESMLSSMFDRVPDLVIRKRGAYDDNKQQKIDAAYNYLVDKLDLEQFMTESAWWFILAGFCSAHGSYRKEYNEVPMYNEFGEVEVDGEGNPATMIEWTYDDPEIKVGIPSKEYFSPESEFSNNADKVPYYIREEMMEVAEIKQIYDVEVEPDSTVKVDGLKDKTNKDDIKRVKVYFYYGQIPEENAEDFEGWEYGKDCLAVYTTKEIIHTEVAPKKCALGKWHGRPDSFFGFGIGKTLRNVQIELGKRRGQQMRYADIAAFPKIAVEMTSEYDEKSLLDPRANVVLQYREKAPEYLTTPDLSNALLVTEDKARQDAQFISGMLDLSKGAQDSQVVKTATGQTIFAEAAEKRVKQMKRQFSRFYLATVIMLLELARDNWSEDKLTTIMDKNTGKEIDVSLSGEDLKDVDFYLDLDIDMESVSVNKEALRAQAIELYNTMKMDPNIRSAEIAKDVLRDGFNKKDPEKYVVDQEQVGNPALGQSAGQVPTNNANILGQTNGMGI